MRVKTIWNNVYSVLQEKPKKRFLALGFTLLFFVILFFLGRHKFTESQTFSGVYQCARDCSITSSIPYDFARELKEGMSIIVDHQTFPFQVKTFGEVSFLTDSLVVQTVVFEVPKLSFYDKQTISFSLVTDAKPFYQIILDSMKGGDG